MKNLKHILAAAMLILTGLHASAQIPKNIDQDIRALRNTAIPGFHCVADDYVQYAPAAVMVGLKACGYKGRSGWGHMLTADAFSVAIMTGITQGMKYSVRRPRPDNARRNSFPSGHTGTAFMTATMLHKEYGWRSPWWSIGGYTVAAFTGVSRILNNRHWMSDVVAGAAIGIGSVHLGYYLSDLIFKDRYINPAYEKPVFQYDAGQKHYVAEMYFGRRFILGAKALKEMGSMPVRGGQAGLSTDIPVIPGVGVTARLAASSMTYQNGFTANLYNASAGGFYNFHFARRFELQAKALAGYAWMHDEEGAILTAGAGLGFMLDDNFKIKVYADYETVCLALHSPWLNSIVLGWSASWFW